MSVPKELKLTQEEVQDHFRRFVDKVLYNGDHPDESKRPYNAMVEHSQGTPRDYSCFASYNFSYTTPIRLDTGRIINLVGKLTFDFVDEDSDLYLDDGYEASDKKETIIKDVERATEEAKGIQYLAENMRL